MIELTSAGVGAAAAAVYLVFGLLLLVGMDQRPRSGVQALVGDSVARAALAWVAWPLAAPLALVLGRRRRARVGVA